MPLSLPTTGEYAEARVGQAGSLRRAGSPPSTTRPLAGSLPALLLVLAASLSAQQAPQTGSIEGLVVNGITGEPLRKAQVTLRSMDSRRSSTYAATTDAGGNFVLRDLEKGVYRLSVERNGYVRAEYGGRVAGRGGPGGNAAISLDAGQKVTGLVMKMSPQAVIAGRVLDSDGDPVVFAAVNVYKYSYLRGKRQLTPAGGATTDDQGEYRIHSLQPGKYYVSASWAAGMGWRGGPGEMRDAAEQTYAPTWYPRSADPVAAVALDAAPGTVLRGIDILLTKVRTVQISGKIVDPGGSGGGRNLMVMAVPRDSLGGMMGGRGGQIQDGKFVIRGIRPGSYMLTAERWENNQRITARLPVEVGDAPLEGLTLVLSPGLTVTGTVRVEGNTRVDVSNVSVLLNARNDSTFSTTGGRAKSDASFSISNAAPDQYTVTVMNLPETCYLKSIRHGDEDSLANGLNLTHGAGDPLDIVLSPSAGSVEAVVLDAKQQPATGVFVVAVPEGARAESQQFYKSAVTDPYGRATLKGLAPGDYKLYAWEDVEALAWMDPDFRKQYEKSGESISIRENGRESKQLTVLAAGDGARP